MEIKNNEQNEELLESKNVENDNSGLQTNDAEEKTSRTTKQKVFLGLKIAGNVLFYALLFFLFLFAIFNINGGNGTENFPHIFGTGYLSVQSDSMKRSVKSDGTLSGKVAEWDSFEIGGFEKGDLLKDSVFDIDDATTDYLKIGMVITFYDPNLKALNTHRIVYVHDNGDGKVDYVKTQGDYEAQLSAYIWEGSKKSEGMTADQINAYNYNLEASNKIEIVDAAQIKGVVKSVTPGAGGVLDNIRQNYLFYFVLPVAVLLIFEIFLVVRNIMILRGEKNKAELEGTREAMMADVEAEKERMRQELLAEMRAQGLVIEETKDEAPVEEKVEDAPVEEQPETNEAAPAEEAESNEGTKALETEEAKVEESTNEEEKEETEVNTSEE